MTHSLVFHISSTAKKIQKSMEYQTRFGQLSFTEASTLLIIKQQKEVFQNEIATRLYLEPASVVSVIDELEKLELVERKSQAEDRRKYKIVLTQKGEEAVQEVRKQMKKLNDFIKKQISIEEYQLMQEALTKIDSRLSERG